MRDWYVDEIVGKWLQKQPPGAYFTVKDILRAHSGNPGILQGYDNRRGEMLIADTLRRLGCMHSKQRLGPDRRSVRAWRRSG